MRRGITVKTWRKIIDEDCIANSVEIMVMKVKMIELKQRLLAVEIESGKASKYIKELKKK